MDRLFKKMLILSVYEVKVLDKDNWVQSKNIFNNAIMVLISVPINITQQIIHKLPYKCILSDLTSIKVKSLKSMLKVHTGPVIGLHSMFGPDVEIFEKQLIICCNKRYPKSYEWLIQQIKSWGADFYFINAKNITTIQSLRYFITFVYRFFLKEEKIKLDQLTNLSSPIYHFALSIVGRLFSQNPELYNEIILFSFYNICLITKYYKYFGTLIELTDNTNPSLFNKNFLEISDCFGSFKTHFLNESRFT